VRQSKAALHALALQSARFMCQAEKHRCLSFFKGVRVSGSWTDINKPGHFMKSMIDAIRRPREGVERTH